MHCCSFGVSSTRLQFNVGANKRRNYLQRFVLICGTKHFINQDLTLLGAAISEALLDNIRGKLLLTHLHNLSSKLSDDCRLFLRFTMFKDMLQRKKTQYHHQNANFQENVQNMNADS